jgi:hypothetical protein
VDETGFPKQEGDQVLGRRPPVLGDRRTHRELPDRRVPRLRDEEGAGVARPRVVPAQGVGR